MSSAQALASASRELTASNPRAGRNPAASSSPKISVPPAPLLNALSVSGTVFGNLPAADLTSTECVSLPNDRSSPTKRSRSALSIDSSVVPAVRIISLLSVYSQCH
jgi:hypothetical protein